MHTADEELEQLIDRCRRDHGAWINGDATGYAITYASRTVLGGFGGVGIGRSQVSAGQERAVRMFESGVGTIEVVGGGRRGDLAWVVMIEKATVRFRGRSDAARWELRVTEVFERVDGTWHRVHRHADPLVDRHQLDDVLALLS